MKNKPFQRKFLTNVFKDHSKYDQFIQNAMDLYYSCEPSQKLYDSAGKFSKYIISNKSTIPDLIIYNKTFNKNDCFYDYHGHNFNKFPRIRWILKTDKKVKDENNKNSNDEETQLKNDNEIDNNKNNANNDNNKNDEINDENKEKNDINNQDEIKEEEEKILSNPDLFFNQIQENDINNNINNDNENNNINNNSETSSKNNNDNNINNDNNENNNKTKKKENVQNKEKKIKKKGKSPEKKTKNKENKKEKSGEHHKKIIRHNINNQIIQSESSQLTFIENKKPENQTENTITKMEVNIIHEIINPNSSSKEKKIIQTEAGTSNSNEQKPTENNNNNSNNNNNINNLINNNTVPTNTNININKNIINTTNNINNPNINININNNLNMLNNNSNNNNNNNNPFISKMNYPQNYMFYNPLNNINKNPLNPSLNNISVPFKYAMMMNPMIHNNFSNPLEDDDDDNSPLFNNFNEDYTKYNPLVFLENPVLIIKKNLIEPHWFLMKNGKIQGNYNSEDLLYYLGEQIRQGNKFENVSITDYPTDVFFLPSNLFDSLKVNVPKLKKKYLKYQMMGIQMNRNKIENMHFNNNNNNINNVNNNINNNNNVNNLNINNNVNMNGFKNFFFPNMMMNNNIIINNNIKNNNNNSNNNKINMNVNPTNK